MESPKKRDFGVYWDEIKLPLLNLSRGCHNLSYLAKLLAACLRNKDILNLDPSKVCVYFPCPYMESGVFVFTDGVFRFFQSHVSLPLDWKLKHTATRMRFLKRILTSLSEIP